MVVALQIPFVSLGGGCVIRRQLKKKLENPLFVNICCILKT